ncbi:hypothetical protein ABZ719_33400 [Streptomyces sp. NPDC006743]|uniref:hypothetical protein n=1 Tax=Streptomyces sp. NPDC006743 TaxID=3154480 RepID=UPI003456CF8A
MNPHRDLGPGMLAGIGQCLLHDPVVGEADYHRQSAGIAVHGQLDGLPGLPGLPDQLVEVGPAGLWRFRGAVPVGRRDLVLLLGPQDAE